MTRVGARCQLSPNFALHSQLGINFSGYRFVIGASRSIVSGNYYASSMMKKVKFISPPNKSECSKK
jgi:hypothetical protein